MVTVEVESATKRILSKERRNLMTIIVGYENRDIRDLNRDYKLWKTWSRTKYDWISVRRDSWRELRDQVRMKTNEGKRT